MDNKTIFICTVIGGLIATQIVRHIRIKEELEEQKRISEMISKIDFSPVIEESSRKVREEFDRFNEKYRYRLVAISFKNKEKTVLCDGFRTHDDACAQREFYSKEYRPIDYFITVEQYRLA